MSTLAPVSNELRSEAMLRSSPVTAAENDAPTVLIATSDASVRDSLAEILEGYRANIEWLRGAEVVEHLLARNRISACLCGFSLEDGSYKDIVKNAKHQRVEVPVVIVSTPECTNEYREYLAAMNTGAFDFLCHPYQKREVERILHSAVMSYQRGAATLHS